MLVFGFGKEIDKNNLNIQKKLNTIWTMVFVNYALGIQPQYDASPNKASKCIPCIDHTHEQLEHHLQQ